MLTMKRELSDVQCVVVGVIVLTLCIVKIVWSVIIKMVLRVNVSHVHRVISIQKRHLALVLCVHRGVEVLMGHRVKFVKLVNLVIWVCVQHVQGVG